MIRPVLIAMVAGWLQRHQQQVITYLLAENRVLKAQLGGRRLRRTDTERLPFSSASGASSRRPSGAAAACWGAPGRGAAWLPGTPQRAGAVQKAV